MTNAHTLPAGEPNLVKAILRASRYVAGYVHRYSDIPGWHVGDCIPRDVPAYYRIFAGRVYVRSASNRAEYLFGRIEGETIIPETKH